jgi:hypothetical protein
MGAEGNTSKVSNQRAIAWILRTACLQPGLAGEYERPPAKSVTLMVADGGKKELAAGNK